MRPPLAEVRVHHREGLRLVRRALPGRVPRQPEELRPDGRPQRAERRLGAPHAPHQHRRSRHRRRREHRSHPRRRPVTVRPRGGVLQQRRDDDAPLHAQRLADAPNLGERRSQQAPDVKLQRPRVERHPHVRRNPRRQQPAQQVAGVRAEGVGVGLGGGSFGRRVLLQQQRLDAVGEGAVPRQQRPRRALVVRRERRREAEVGDEGPLVEADVAGALLGVGREARLFERLGRHDGAALHRQVNHRVLGHRRVPVAHHPALVEGARLLPRRGERRDGRTARLQQRELLVVEEPAEVGAEVVARAGVVREQHRHHLLREVAQREDVAVEVGDVGGDSFVHRGAGIYLRGANGAPFLTAHRRRRYGVGRKRTRVPVVFEHTAPPEVQPSV